MNNEISKWVPKDALFCWEVMIKPQLSLSLKSSLLSTELPSTGVSSLQSLSLQHLKKRFALQNDALILIPKLFTDFPESQELWEEASKNEYYNGHQLCFAIYQAFIGPDDAEDTLPDKERNEWRDRVQSTSSNLYGLICGTKYSSLLDKRDFDLFESVKEAISDELGRELPANIASRLDSIFQNAPSLPLVLDELSKINELEVINWMDLAYTSHKVSGIKVTMKTTRGETAERAFFVRYMTEFFKAKTNKPRRKIVTILADKLFWPIHGKNLRGLAK